MYLYILQVTLCDCTADSLAALLEYLYSDHAPIEEAETVGLLALSDQYCQSRLITLIELYASKNVEKACEQSIKNADIDVIGLLQASQVSTCV